MATSFVEIAPQYHISRRTLLRLASCWSAGVAVSLPDRATEMLFAQEPRGTSTSNAPLNRFPRMVHEWFVEQVKEAESKTKERLARLKTKEDAEAYVESVRERVRQSFGPDPERRH